MSWHGILPFTLPQNTWHYPFVVRLYSEFWSLPLFLCSFIYYLLGKYLLSIYSMLGNWATWSLHSQRKQWQKMNKWTEVQNHQSRVRDREWWEQGAGLHRCQGRLSEKGRDRETWMKWEMSHIKSGEKAFQAEGRASSKVLWWEHTCLLKDQSSWSKVSLGPVIKSGQRCTQDANHIRSHESQ